MASSDFEAGLVIRFLWREQLVVSLRVFFYALRTRHHFGSESRVVRGFMSSFMFLALLFVVHMLCCEWGVFCISVMRRTKAGVHVQVVVRVHAKFKKHVHYFVGLRALVHLTLVKRPCVCPVLSISPCERCTRSLTGNVLREMYL